MNGQPQRMCLDLMKAVRSQAMTRRELKEHLGWSDQAVRNWVSEFSALGVLVPVHVPRRPGSHGCLPIGYRLSPAWGGVAA